MFIKMIPIASAALLGVALHDALPDLQPGAALPTPDVMMKDVTGKELSLKGVAGKNGLLVIFSCNTCPFVIGGEGSEGWEGRYPALGSWCRKHDVGMVLVNSNEAKREKGDGFADMQAHYREKGYTSHYVLDQGHVVADAFGARTTPHVFLFDKDLKLAYKGAIDDNVDSATAVKEHWLQNALEAVTNGKAVDPALTRNLGCSIKRVPHTH